MVAHIIAHLGPTFPVSNGSVLGPLQAVGSYIVQIIQKMQREQIHSFDPRQAVADQFNHHAQTWINGTTWVSRQNHWASLRLATVTAPITSG